MTKGYLKLFKGPNLLCSIIVLITGCDAKSHSNFDF